MNNYAYTCVKFSVFSVLILTVIATFSVSAQVAPTTLGQSFVPSSILQGETSTLSFEITGLQPGIDAAFSSTLPAGLVVATPANAVSNCGVGVPDTNNGREEGVVVAVAGSSQISYTKAGVVSGDNCLVEVDVLSTAAGLYDNPAVTLFYDGGTQQTLSNIATLAVEGGGTGQNPAPVFSKSFSPDVIGYGARSTLTFTIDNSLGGNLSFINFSDNLPDGMLIAEPANATSTCPIGSAPGSTSTLTAVAGSDFITYRSTQNAGLPAYDLSETICTISVDVIVNATSLVTNISEELITTAFFSNNQVSSGRAVASITANGGRLEMTAEFVGDPMYAGGPVDVVYVLYNTDRTYPATDVAFTNDLDAALSGMIIDGVSQNDCDGLVSLEPIGSASEIIYSGGTLPPEGSCSITLSLLVPGNAASGEYPNSTSEISGTSIILVTTQVGEDEDGIPIFETTEVEVTITGMPATSTLFVSPIPLLSKTFSSEIIAAGDPNPVEIVFSITNTSSTSIASDVAFVDELTTFLPFPINAILPASACDTGLVELVFLGTDRQGISLTGGTLAASETCTFTVGLTLPEGLPSGTYVNTTEVITATVDGETVTGRPATDSFVLVAPPKLTKEFIDDPVEAGALVTLQFTLKNSGDAPGPAATLIGFTDNLNDAVTGLAVEDIDLPAMDVCGVGSELSAPTATTLSFTGGSLAAGESCSFSVDLRVPGDTASGSYTNTSSAVVAEVLGLALTGTTASGDLMVGGLVLSKAFDPDLALPGTSVDLTYTVTSMTASSATEITFIEDLGNTIPGLNISAPIPPNPLLSDFCGPGSSLILTGDILIFTGGLLDPMAVCSFTVSLDIPAATPSSSYGSTTGSFAYTIDGSQVPGEPAFARLTVTSDVLDLTKEFIGDPVCPGGIATLRFTMTNLLAAEDISAISFTDDLDAALVGLNAVGGELPQSVCGGTAILAGLSGAVIDFSDGVLTGGSSCSFDVDVVVDPSTSNGSVALNETSTISGLSAGVVVNGAAATDDMQVNCVEFSKVFAGDGSVVAGESTQLSFTLSYSDAAEGVEGLSFTDDLEAMLTGMEAMNLPMTDVCGTGSIIDGTDLVSLRGASLLPAGSCTFSIDVQIPEATAEGTYENISSELYRGDFVVADPATALLLVLPPAPLDSDGDGVLDDVDVCLGTVIPELVPTHSLKPNRYALVDDDTIFDVGSSKSGKSDKNCKSGKSGKSGKSCKSKAPPTFTVEDTAGCSCEQIIEAAGLGSGHTKHGCSLGVMLDWVDLVNLPVD